jgi:hypothetical protein
MREVRLGHRPVRAYLLCGPLLRLGTLACISAPECTRHCTVLPIAKSQYFLANVRLSACESLK